MDFSDACCEVDFILDNLNPEDKKKIPEMVINFFKNNKSSEYKVNLTPNKPLSEQTLKDETKAFLQIINYKYFANKKQKEEFEAILKEENIKKILVENLTVEDIKVENIDNNFVNNEIEESQTELTVYKENKILKFFKRILNMFKKD